MLQSKRVKRNATVAIVAVFLIIGYLLNIFLNSILHDRLQLQLQKNSYAVEELFKSSIIKHKKSYLNRLNLILNSNVAKALYMRDKKLLHKLILPSYKLMVKENPYVSTMIFHLADSSSPFLLMGSTNSAHFDKNRTLTASVNSLKRVHYGFEVRKLEALYNIAIPVFYQNSYIGLVELNILPEFFLKNISNILNLSTALAVKDKAKSIKNRELHFNSKKLHLLTGNRELFMAHFSKPLINNFEMLKHENRTYGVSAKLDIVDHGNNHIATLLVAEDATEGIADIHSTSLKFILIYAISFLALYFIINIGFRFFIKSLKKLLYIDDLTKLYGRRALQDELDNQKQRILILIDINNFKSVNELYTIASGNEVLIQFSELLREIAKKDDFLLFRASSDEFVFTKKSEIFDASYCHEFIDSIYIRVENHSFFLKKYDEKVNIDITLGLSYGESNLLEKADMAIIHARAYKQPYMAYIPSIDTKQDTKQIVAKKRTIHFALDNNKVLPFFQPIVNRDGEIVKYEALVRIVQDINGEERVLTPNTFLELSIKFNLYPRITKTMLKRSLDIFRDRDEQISINLSPSDIIDKRIRQFIKKIIRSYPNPQKIVLELTEQEGLDDFKEVQKFIEDIQKIGAEFAIDDFGSGYANYAHILEMKPNYLKIDGSLISNILTDEKSQILVKSIIDFAKKLNITTIAEFVSSKEIFERLKEYGVDQFQGYYFGAPSPKLD